MLVAIVTMKPGRVFCLERPPFTKTENIAATLTLLSHTAFHSYRLTSSCIVPVEQAAPSVSHTRERKLSGGATSLSS